MNQFLRQLSGQWVGILIGAIVTTAISLLIWWISRKKRQLVYAVNPVSTRVVVAGQSSKLKVSYADRSYVDVDITAIQIAVWHAGKETIEKGDIRGSVSVLKITDRITKKPVEILEATVRNQSPSPDVVGFDLKPMDLWIKGEVPLSWAALERNEGASIQLLFLGTPDVDINPGGRIKENGFIKRKTVRSDFKTFREYQKSRRNSLWSLLVTSLFIIITAIMRFGYNLDLDGWVSIIFVFSILGCFLSLMSVLSARPGQFPPFEF